jgi:hypothetical protein
MRLAAGTDLRLVWERELPNKAGFLAKIPSNREEREMRIKTGFYLGAATIALAFAFTGPSAQLQAQQPAQVAIDNDDIGGVVTGPSGPEAGVWVIAETKDLPTRFTKAVVTDDQGRYVIPDLPKAKYSVWVRGYGLVDSAKVESEPGKQLNLRATPAPNDAAAAAYYPAIYWYSMLKIPEQAQFGGKSGIPERIKQIDWLNLMKNNGCVGCHQLGTLSTRTVPAFFGPSSKDAWMRRIQAGQAGELMVNVVAGQLSAEPLAYFTDWTDRIAKGELPSTKPQRPSGLERNIVVSTWDWADEKHYLHDLIATDKRNPTVNAGGPVYGQPEYSMGYMPIVDPKTNTATMFKAPIRDANMHENLGPGHAAMVKPLGPSAYWGDEKIWEAYFNNHNSMLDEKGRVWMAASFRDEKNQPAYCKADSGHPSAKLDGQERSGRQLTVYDPKTQKYDFVDVCFTTHHLNFAMDANNTLWTSSGGGGGVVGWVNVKKWDETHDAGVSQGWTALIVDTSGDGKRGEYTQPGRPTEPGKDMRLGQVIYAVSVSPKDGSVWGTIRTNPGAIVRIVPGANPPETTLTEVYNVPLPGFGPRGGDIDSNGVYWASLGSGHIGSFDRTKCKGPLNGPTATGNHCPEGWSFYKYPGPGFAGIGDNSAESSYYSWVDQHNTFGMGNDVPVSTANLMDGLVALGKDGKMVSLRVPYPMGFFAKGLDGRIDDPNAGWKGRGLWTSSGDRAPWQVEGGKGMKPMAVHFQMRPDPLAH